MPRLRVVMYASGNDRDDPKPLVLLVNAFAGHEILPCSGARFGERQCHYVINRHSSDGTPIRALSSSIVQKSVHKCEVAHTLGESFPHPEGSVKGGRSPAQRTLDGDRRTRESSQ